MSARGRFALFVAAMLGGMAPAVAEALRPFTVVGGAISEPLTQTPGDVALGRAIVVDRQRGLCLLCHSGPFPDVRLQGTLAPSLAGAGTRSTLAQLRLRIVDPARIDPKTIMPSYYRTDGLIHVAPAFKGKPILSAQEIEDVVAFVATLKE